METELLTIQQGEDLQKSSENPSSLSKEELKDFYLKLARLTCSSACTSKRNDFEVLSILHKDLKKSLGILNKFVQHDWGEGILEIQTACGAYSMQDAIPQKDRLELNAALGKHLQFLMQMASSNSAIKKIYAEYNRHFFNVEYLLKQLSKEKKGSNK